MTESSAGRSERLRTGLLVDDDATFSIDASALMEERLRGRGVLIRFTQANSPEAAIAIIRSSPPFDLVMTDMLFPAVGQPDAPLGDHAQRGTDIMRAARKADAKVVIGFTRVKSQRFQEWRTRCRDLAAGFYQRDDLIVAEEDSVAGDIADMILSVGRDADPALRTVPEVGRGLDPKAVAIVCRPHGGVKRVASEFLESLGLHPLDFDHLAEVAQAGKIPSPEFLKGLFRDVQAVLVVLTPDQYFTSDRRYEGSHDTTEARFEPGSRVLVEAGMALSTDRARTVLVRLGQIADTNFLYEACIEVDDSPGRRQALAQRLEAVGCQVSQGEGIWDGSFRDALSETYE